MPLGISDYCFLLEYEEKWGVKCPDLCQKELFLKQGDWAMKTLGKGILSGKDVCMLEHLPRLLADGHRFFRIEALSESPAYRSEVAAVYRAALQSGRRRRRRRWTRAGGRLSGGMPGSVCATGSTSARAEWTTRESGRRRWGLFLTISRAES